MEQEVSALLLPPPPPRVAVSWGKLASGGTGGVSGSGHVCLGTEERTLHPVH